MKTAIIRQKLHQFIETAEEKKVKAMYALLENEIAQDEWEYTDEFKADLDRRFSYYKSGGKMVSAKDANKQINEFILYHHKRNPQKKYKK
jgi:hypothetical protein